MKYLIAEEIASRATFAQISDVAPIDAQHQKEALPTENGW
jgi:hypothetical protein